MKSVQSGRSRFNLEGLLLAFIMVSFVALGSIYAITTPVFEASDELWHYPMVRHLADGNALPVQVFDPAAAGPWKQEASQPPLYYYLAAALTFWVDTSDMEVVRWLNPHVDNGVITADGNTNLVVHDPHSNPWQGTQLAVRISRLFSVLLGALTVFLTYKIAGEVAPGRPEITLGSAAVNAYLPMFLFISGAVNNDNLVIPLASLALLIMIRIVTKDPLAGRQEISSLLLLGIVIGLGTLSKITAVGLLLFAPPTIFLSRWQLSDRYFTLRRFTRLMWETAGRLLLVLLPVILIAGWWYVRNLSLYNDWSGWNAFTAVLGQRAHPAGLGQLWDERWGFMMSYWGLFGGLNVPMAEWLYHLMNGILLFSVFGFVVYSARLLQKWVRDSAGKVLSFSTFLANGFNFIECNYALLICLLWVMAVAAGLIRWATVTWSSQGRLVFSAISTLSILMVVGMAGWLPRKPAAIVVSGVSLLLLTVATLAPFVWIKPAYQLHHEEDTMGIRIVNEVFAKQMALIGYDLSSDQVRPGENLDITLQWQALAEMDRDWSVFVHLHDPVVDAPISQRDMFPGQGMVATTLLEPGRQLVDHIQLHVPETAVAPAELMLRVGLYDYYSGERLQTAGGLDALDLSKVALLPVPGLVPNPLQVNFDNQLELNGFNINPRRVSAGDAIDLTLYWKPLIRLESDYTFFAQVIDVDTTRWAGQDLVRPTAEWPEGELQVLTLPLNLDEKTPPGVYPIIIGAYTRAEDGGFDRLQMVTPEGRLTEDFLVLGAIRVD